MNLSQPEQKVYYAPCGTCAVNGRGFTCEGHPVPLVQQASGSLYVAPLTEERVREIAAQVWTSLWAQTSDSTITETPCELEKLVRALAADVFQAWHPKPDEHIQSLRPEIERLKADVKELSISVGLLKISLGDAKGRLPVNVIGSIESIRSRIAQLEHAGEAQPLVEHPPRKREDAGSSPAPSSNSPENDPIAIALPEAREQVRWARSERDALDRLLRSAVTERDELRSRMGNDNQRDGESRRNQKLVAQLAKAETALGDIATHIAPGAAPGIAHRECIRDILIRYGRAAVVISTPAAPCVGLGSERPPSEAPAPTSEQADRSLSTLIEEAERVRDEARFDDVKKDLRCANAALDEIAAHVVAGKYGGWELNGDRVVDILKRTGRRA